jgi:hypothetical protein
MNDTAGVTAARGAILLRDVMNQVARFPLLTMKARTTIDASGQKDSLFGELILTLAKGRARVYGRIHSHNCITTHHLDGSIEPMLHAYQQKSRLALKSILAHTTFAISHRCSVCSRRWGRPFRSAVPPVWN